MPDTAVTTAGASTDNGTTITNARFNALMADYSRARARADALEQRLADSEASQEDPAAVRSYLDNRDEFETFMARKQADDAQAKRRETFEALRPEFDPGPPTPMSHGEARDFGGARRESEIDRLRGNIDRAVGKRSGQPDWDILG